LTKFDLKLSTDFDFIISSGREFHSLIVHLKKEHTPSWWRKNCLLLKLEY